MTDDNSVTNTAGRSAGFPGAHRNPSSHCIPEEGVLRELQLSSIKQNRDFSDKKKKGIGIPGRG